MNVYTYVGRHFTLPCPHAVFKQRTEHSRRLRYHKPLTVLRQNRTGIFASASGAVTNQALLLDRLYRGHRQRVANLWTMDWHNESPAIRFAVLFVFDTTNLPP